VPGFAAAKRRRDCNKGKFTLQTIKMLEGIHDMAQLHRKLRWTQRAHLDAWRATSAIWSDAALECRGLGDGDRARIERILRIGFAKPDPFHFLDPCSIQSNLQFSIAHHLNVHIEVHQTISTATAVAPPTP
jgi:hypothetical protein